MPKTKTTTYIDDILSFYIEASMISEVTNIGENDYNSVYLVKLIGGKKKILRIRKKASWEEVEFEVGAVEHFSQKNIPTQKYDDSIEGNPIIETNLGYTLFCDYIEGEAINRETYPNTKQAKSAGELLAKMHKAGSIDTCPETFHHFTDSLSIVFKNRDEIKKKYTNGSDFIGEVRSSLDFIAINGKKEKWGLIQNDYRPQNLLFDKKKGNIKAIIDFDWVVFGPFIWDLALAVLEWSCPDGKEYNPKNAQAFLAAYNQVAGTKIRLDEYFIKWMMAVALDSACCYLLGNQDPKKEVRGYMYRKYKTLKEMIDGSVSL